MASLHAKEIRRLLRSLSQQGARLTTIKKGVLVRFPNGKSTTIHWTNSDYRSQLNMRAEIKRNGLTWPFDHQHKRKEHTVGKALTIERHQALDAIIKDWDGPVIPAELGRKAEVSEPTAIKALKKAGFAQRAPRGPWFAPEPVTAAVDKFVDDALATAESYEEIDRARREAQGQRDVDMLLKREAEFEAEEAEAEKVTLAEVGEATDARTKTWLTDAEKVALAEAIKSVGDGPTSPAKLAREANVSPNAASRHLLKEGFTMQRRGTWTRPATPKVKVVPPAATAPGTGYMGGTGYWPTGTGTTSVTMPAPTWTVSTPAPAPTASPAEREFVDEKNSWTVPVPAKLQRMADEMGLNIEVRVWRD